MSIDTYVLYGFLFGSSADTLEIAGMPWMKPGVEINRAQESFELWLEQTMPDLVGVVELGWYDAIEKNECWYLAVSATVEPAILGALRLPRPAPKFAVGNSPIKSWDDKDLRDLLKEFCIRADIALTYDEQFSWHLIGRR